MSINSMKEHGIKKEGLKGEHTEHMKIIEKKRAAGEVVKRVEAECSKNIQESTEAVKNTAKDGLKAAVNETTQAAKTEEAQVQTEQVSHVSDLNVKEGEQLADADNFGNASAETSDAPSVSSILKKAREQKKNAAKDLAGLSNDQSGDQVQGAKEVDAELNKVNSITIDS